MQQRDNVSEGILWSMAVFTSLLLMVCPGALLWFVLPPPIGIVALLLCGVPGPAMMLWLDRDLYGTR